MDIFTFDSLYHRLITKQGVTDSVVNLDLDRTPPGKVRVLSHISAENKDSAFTLLRYFIYDGFIEHPIDEAIHPSKDELCIHNNMLVLGEGEILRAAFTGTTTGDDLILYVLGWEFFK